MKTSLLAAVCIAAATVASPAHAKATPDWPQFLKDFQEAYFVSQPAFAVSQGRHEFDGKLPDFSEQAIKSRIAWLHLVEALSENYPPAKLGAGERYQRDYLLAVTDRQLFWLEEARAPFTNPAFYLDDLDPAVYLSRPYAPLKTRLHAYIAYLKAVPNACAQIRANLKSPLAKPLVDRGVAAFAGYAEFFRGDALKTFDEVKDAKLRDELKAATEPAARAMQELSEWLKGERAKATDAFALGPKLFADMLWRTERVDTPIDQLHAIGMADLRRNQAALKDACAKYLPAGSIEDCVGKMAGEKPQGGPVQAARRQLTQLRQFIVDHKLVTIPGTELAQVDEAPPYQRANFAYINIPGPFDKGMPSTYYISPPDPAWSKAEQDAYVPGEKILLFTSVHEVWPGHFLQFLHANRSPFEFGRVFVGYAFAEGWAHYAEEMMWDSGLGDGAADVHLGQLTNALTRDVRFLCAIGMHAQGMTVDQCEKMFLEEAHRDPGTSRQQAARGTYDPAYLNYTLGKLMIRKLRDDWSASRGAQKAWPKFHDQFLSYGGPPVPLVRAQMLGSKKGDLF